ncbi:MAG: hypothetical protein FGM39_11495 [Phycisphaerales bacterium]|nr:hypothetical protein [Phycisphaerales bacterium]
MQIRNAFVLAASGLVAGAAHADFIGWTARVKRVSDGYVVHVFAATNNPGDTILNVSGGSYGLPTAGFIRTNSPGGFLQGATSGSLSVFAPSGSQSWTTLDSFLTVGGGLNTTTGAWTANSATMGDPAWNVTYMDTETQEQTTVNGFNTPSNNTGFQNPYMSVHPPTGGWFLAGASSPARSLAIAGERHFASSPAAAAATAGMLVAQLYVRELTPIAQPSPKTIEWKMSATLRRPDGSTNNASFQFVIGRPPCVNSSIFRQSGELAPFSFANPRTWTVSGIGPVQNDAQIRVRARGNLGTSTRFLTLKADGVTIATGIFGSGSGAGNCTDVPSSVDFTIPAAQFASLVADGQLVLRVEPSLNATSDGCSNATLSLDLEYVPVPTDCDQNGFEDPCEIEQNPTVKDCNRNGLLDVCEIASGAADVNQNGVLDACEADCNANGLPDGWEIAQGISPDCNANGKPDSCDIASGHSADIDGNGIPDPCQPDCNGNGRPDAWETAQGLVPDCNNNSRPDSCDIAGNPQLDCNLDGIIDTCQGGPGGPDCNANGILDICEIAGGAEDKNDNGKLDSCELAYGDLNLDGVIDGLDLGGLLALWGAQNPPYGDLNGDGWVDGNDLGLLLARWGPVI